MNSKHYRYQFSSSHINHGKYMPTAAIPHGYKLQGTRTFSGADYCKPTWNLGLKNVFTLGRDVNHGISINPKNKLWLCKVEAFGNRSYD